MTPREAGFRFFRDRVPTVQAVPQRPTSPATPPAAHVVDRQLVERVQRLTDEVSELRRVVDDLLGP